KHLAIVGIQLIWLEVAAIHLLEDIEHRVAGSLICKIDACKSQYLRRRRSCITCIARLLRGFFGDFASLVRAVPSRSCRNGSARRYAIGCSRSRQRPFVTTGTTGTTTSFQCPVSILHARAISWVLSYSIGIFAPESFQITSGICSGILSV